MGNIKFAIKRILKNKNTVTIMSVLLALGILYWAYYNRIKTQTEPVNVPVAVTALAPRTEITDDMVTTRKVPGGIVNDRVITNRNDIVGKYVINTAVIPEGSMFYKDTVVSWEQLPSSLYENIDEGYTVVYLPVSLESTYGNSIFPGNYIDLYYRGYANLDTGNIKDKNSKLIYGKFISNIRVLAVVDSDGNSVFETIDTPRTPAYLMFAVPEDMHILISKAKKMNGEIIPVVKKSKETGYENETKISSRVIENLINEIAFSQDEVYGTKVGN